MSDVKQVTLLETRGRNKEGKLVGTVFIEKQDGRSATFEVIFNDAELDALEKSTKQAAKETDIEAKKAEIEKNVPDRANILNAAYIAQEFFPNETREELEKRLQEEIDHINLLVKKLKEKGVPNEKIIKQIKDYISNGNRVISRREGLSDFVTYLVENNTRISTDAELAAQGKPTDAKAEIEIRINDTISKIFGSESLFNFDTNQPGKVINNEFIPDNLGSQLFNAINKTLKGEVVQTNKAEAEKLFKEYAKTVHPDKNQSEQANVIAEAFFKAMSTAKEQGRVDILNELKTKFDAELDALEGAKPAEEAPVDLSQIKKDDSDAGEYRMVGVADEERMTNAELEIFKQWHAEKVPFIPFEVLERMVEMNDNEEAWGVFENGVAKFVRGGLRGTEYHEIGHGIWKLLSPEEQQAILADERSKPGTFKDRAS
jgi:hypothetical protein